MPDDNARDLWRCWTRFAIAVLPVVILACRKDEATLADRVMGELGANRGIILMFEPSTCTLSQPITSALNRAAEATNERVIGLAHGVDTMLTPLAVVARDFDLRFGVRALNDDRVLSQLNATGVRLPAVIIVRFGQIVAIESLGETGNSRYLP